MGFFSKCCAKSHLPVLTKYREVPLLSNVVALLPSGEIVRGMYDGYGRVDDVELRERGADWIWPEVKLVLAIYYKGETYEQLGPSGNELAQGYFMSDEFLQYCMKRGSFKSRAEYEQAFKKYANW